MGREQKLKRQFGRILTSKECNRRNILPVELAGSSVIKNTGNRGRLCGMPWTLRISQAFLSVRNRKITGLQACCNRMVTVQFAEGLLEHFLSEQKSRNFRFAFKVKFWI